VGFARIIRKFTNRTSESKRIVEDRREAFYHGRIRESGPEYRGFDRLSAEITLNLLYTYDVFHQLSARYMARYGLSKSTLNILMLLRHGSPEGMQLHELGELLLVSKANITGLIDHLEEKDLVKRVINARDRRARFARITKKGEALLDEVLPVHYQNVKWLLNDLTTDDKQMLIKLLRKARASLMANSTTLESDQLHGSMRE
jgi:MarR family transcriptional regulator, 2-MHQ and catechol-resistance regulon repressor